MGDPLNRSHGRRKKRVVLWEGEDSMNRSLFVRLGMVACLALLLPSTALCSWQVDANVGAGIPTGTFGDFFKSGLLVGGSVGYVSAPFEFGVDASYLKNDPSDSYQSELDALGAEGDAKFLQYGVHARWMSQQGMLSPYLGAGVGMYNLKDQYQEGGTSVDVEDTQVGVHGNAGLNYWAGRSWGLGLDASYHVAFTDESLFAYDKASFFSIAAGLRFRFTPGTTQ
jgi:opacity protein-like surface antigen